MALDQEELDKVIEIISRVSDEGLEGVLAEYDDKFTKLIYSRALEVDPEVAKRMEDALKKVKEKLVDKEAEVEK